MAATISSKAKETSDISQSALVMSSALNKIATSLDTISAELGIMQGAASAMPMSSEDFRAGIDEIKYMLKKESELSLIRMFNAQATRREQLRFPVDGVGEFIESKNSIAELTVYDCRVVLSLLEIPYSDHANFLALQGLITDYLAAW
ncbi:hypothetical protein TWF106_004029 [Orbilia oligospora]|uniref:Uncharacterized protein n=1 Tax=Orbilia oligospora TaxID=2813651 RepID=A0A6G1M108_ORBOL|nr:hypothetical protein TWF788_009185 [Orbilia oligospora]KAF3198349.1 hypothetical protein TWF191_004934 [Orbilia oligospora]KAF3199110.1 hypothetical protein TWF106_004029 [Orbilia oligospora]KAF3223831.1 hypothetical protein TWF679_000266 [Orbilia oligospora]KAF3241611.1 hypothetical protein TWF192_008904 [Orbilia oligospora]